MPASALSVGVEGGVLARPLPTGVDRYARSILGELATRQPSWRLQIGVLRGAGRLDPALARLGNVRTGRAAVPDRAYRALAARHVRLPFDLAAGVPRTDVFVFPDFVVWPLVRRRPVVAFVYDLSFLHHADQADARHADYLARQVRHTVRHADRIVTISHAVREELLEEYALPAGRVHCVYPGVDQQAFRPAHSVGSPGSGVSGDSGDTVRQRLNLPARFLLMTGTVEPRKNLLAAVEAYDALPDAVRAEVALVVVGRVGWRSEATMAAIHRPREVGRVTHLGFTTDAHLAELYRAAELLLFPSLYEGFGLPIVEAMACGTPVLAARRRIVAEVGADAVALTDAEDPAAFAASIEALLDDAQERTRLRAAGLLRARDFTWAAAADAFADVLRHTVG